MWRAIVVACFITAGANAQTGSITGRVIDATSLEPLPFANVFINNTTLGTSTDAQGNFTLNNVPAGSQEAVFSFVGYATYQARYAVAENQVTRAIVRLTPVKQELNEVSVKAGRDKTWEKHLKKFERIFFGDDDFGRRCSITNPWVIDFVTDGPKLIATASAPVEIVNEALGYRLSFHLKEFSTDGSTFAIIGNTRYQEMETPSGPDALMWTRNRQTAYRRSVRYFFKSLIDQHLSQDGFRLYLDVSAATPARSNSFNTELTRNVKPYEPSSIVGPGNSVYELKVQMPEKVEVHYINEATRSFFYKDVGHSVTWLETKGGSVRVTRGGVLLNPRELVVSGDMSLGRVAEMLPLDYKPGAAVVVSETGSLQSARYEEKVYLHVSKSYGYPGETIWWKVYMAYRDASKRDSLSNVLYVELIDPSLSVVQSRTMRLDTLTYGEFRLPDELKPGMYAVRAYTNWMRNYGGHHFFTTPFPVLDAYEKISGASAPPVGNKMLEIRSDKSPYGTREQAQVNVIVRDKEGEPVHANLSVSVVDLRQVKSLPWKETIDNKLRFDDPAFAATPFSHRVEKGFSLFGKVSDEKGRTQPADLTLILGNFDGVYTTKAHTDGSFAVHDMLFYDSAVFAIQSTTKKKSKSQFELLDRDRPIVDFRPSDYKLEVEKESTVQRVVPQYELDQDVIMLKEVSVGATRIETKKPVYNTYGQAERVITGTTLAEKGGTLGVVLQGLMPGYSLAQVRDHWYFIRERSMNSSGSQFKAQPKDFIHGGPSQAAPAEPVLIIDNALFATGMGETVGDRLQSMNTSIVDRVEINSQAGSLTGSLGAAGVINIFTKRGTQDPGLLYHRITVKGFESPGTFLAPDYSTPVDEHLLPDVRSTVYWNPLLQVSETGEGGFSFYTTDLAGTYLVVVEGMLADGTPVRGEKIVEVVNK